LDKRAAVMHPGSLALGWGPLSALVRHQVFLVSAAGTVVAAAVLMVGGVVPLPSLVERGWHVLVPGAAQRAPHRAPAPVTRRLERGAAGSFDRRVPFAPARRVVRAVLPADRSTGRPSAQRGRAHAPVDIRPTGISPGSGPRDPGGGTSGGTGTPGPGPPGPGGPSGGGAHATTGAPGFPDVSVGLRDGPVSARASTGAAAPVGGAASIDGSPGGASADTTVAGATAGVTATVPTDPQTPGVSVTGPSIP